MRMDLQTKSQKRQMKAEMNENLHIVKGQRNEEGYYTVKCPHNASFEYINGWGVRMVGSACCGACPWNVNHKRHTEKGFFDVKCMHKPGTETRKASIIKTNV